MKKMIVSLMMIMVLFVGSVQAAPKRGGHHFSPAPVPHHQPVHHKKAPKYNHHRHHKSEPIIGFFAGLIGSVIGNYIISDYSKPVHYNNVHCFSMVSRSNGALVKKCVNTSDWIYRSQAEIYETLYIN